MADIRDWDAFKRGRWNWTAGGYEHGLGPCAFGDIDAHLERRGWHLFIEAKHYENGRSMSLSIPTGQWIALRSLIANGHTVWLLLGDATANDPLFLRMWHQQVDGALGKVDDDYRQLPIEQRRERLRSRINQWYAFANSTPQARRASLG